jgi:cellulose synthase/poly-beta-1,6-N-acetylglucosamine synthase-like glycosyltransferase
VVPAVAGVAAVTRRAAWRDWSAERTVTAPQAVAGGGALVLLGVLLVVAPGTAAALAVGALTGLFVATTTLRIVYFVSGYRALGVRRDAPYALPAGALPSFTVMAPVYKEAGVVPALLDAIAALDYPADRVQVLLLVEHDDDETRAACLRHARPPWEVVDVPPGRPRTKPRALNVALARTTGELLTIYDAEDRPDPGQLRAAAGAFAALGPRVASLQARLDFYNARQNLLTKWFACEYATHFGLYLEGIAARGHAMPLGGTSTHFRTAAVREAGGWDAWNVTEDCELGMRLAAAGYEARTLDSATHEEAVPMLAAWIRQRSRWVKGFAQTALAMTRAPVAVARAMGVRRYAAALVTVAGVPLVLVSQLVCWVLLWLYVALRASGSDVAWIEGAFPEPLLTLGMLSLLVGNFAILLAHVGAVYQQGLYDLVRYALLLPAYWLLASLGAWRGVAQLVSRPHFWEKTRHGLAPRPAPAPAPTPAPVTAPVPSRAPSPAPVPADWRP